MTAGPRLTLRAMFRAFYTRNYRLFWFGEFVSQCGTWMQRVAQAWLVLELTDSPLALGITNALQFSPLLLLSLFAGVVADRLPKRRLLLITEAALALQALAIALLTSSGQIQLWHIYLLTALFGLASAFNQPARGAFVMEMAGPEDLPNAVALTSSLRNATRMIGPAAAGALIAGSGVAACFWLNAVSYLAVLGALLAMRPSELFDVPSPARGRMLGQVTEGLRYALRSRDISLVIMLLAVLGSFGFNLSASVPLLARYVLDSGPLGLGVLFTCMSGGSVVVGLVLAARQEASERALLAGAAAFSVSLALVALSPWFALTAALMVLLGGAGIVFSATASTRMQIAAPAALRGRVMSLHALLFMGTSPLGSFMLGTLSEYVGVRSAILIMSGVCGTGVLAGLFYVRRRPATRADVPARSDIGISSQLSEGTGRIS